MYFESYYIIKVCINRSTKEICICPRSYSLSKRRDKGSSSSYPIAHPLISFRGSLPSYIMDLQTLTCEEPFNTLRQICPSQQQVYQFLVPSWLLWSSIFLAVIWLCCCSPYTRTECCVHLQQMSIKYCYHCRSFLNSIDSKCKMAINCTLWKTCYLCSCLAFFKRNHT